MFVKQAGLALLASLLAATAATAKDAKPAIIYDIGGKFDKSFNEGTYHGALAFKAKTGVPFREFEIQNEAQREQALTRFARDGNDPIVVPGFAWGDALTKVAKAFPKTHFTILDDVVDLPNVQSVVFREEQGSFLVGVLAAKASKSGKFGFVGGMDVPLIHKFGCGYAQGIKYANPQAQVFANMTGTTGAAWNDPVKGGELAKAQIDRGADVVYAAAGATGLGVLRATTDAGKLGIGVDSDQNGIAPGKILTSMMKRVDIATENSFQAAKDGTWKGGVHVLGLKENGVDWAYDNYNKTLITPAMKKAVEDAKSGIIGGKINVHDYMQDQKCPA